MKNKSFQWPESVFVLFLLSHTRIRIRWMLLVVPSALSILIGRAQFGGLVLLSPLWQPSLSASQPWTSVFFFAQTGWAASLCLHVFMLFIVCAGFWIRELDFIQILLSKAPTLPLTLTGAAARTALESFMVHFCEVSIFLESPLSYKLEKQQNNPELFSISSIKSLIS